MWYAHPDRGGRHLPVHVTDPRGVHVRHGEQPYLMITGGTGFVGSMLLGELLKRGHPCMVLVRHPVPDRRSLLIKLLGNQGIDAPRLFENGQMCVLGGELPGGLPNFVKHPIRAVVHVAGSTQFHTDSNGEPSRTNDNGTRQLLVWMDQHSISAIHHVSTAYVFGDFPSQVPESVLQTPPKFRNAYERSKWFGERHVYQWGMSNGHSATIYRPSIVVGDWQTGYATRFSGPYLAFAALDAMRQKDTCRMVRPMHISAKRDANLNLIPVDYLVGLMGSIIEQPSYHGRVYNIVHPDPVSTSSLFLMIERLFGVSCDHLNRSDTSVAEDRTPGERRFSVVIRHLGKYLNQPPQFERANTAMAERRFARSCPRWDEPAIGRLIDYARGKQWGCLS